MYEIKTYQEGFIEEQYKIGSAIYDKWRMGGQTRPEQLKQAYSKEDFDPETRFYAFSGNEMVGFLTASAIDDNKIYFEFPYSKIKHSAVREYLIQHAIEALKVKGFKVLVTRAGRYWVDSLELAKLYDFKFTGDIVNAGHFQINSFNQELSIDDNFNVKNYEPELFDEVAKFVSDRIKQPLDQVINWIKPLSSITVGQTTKNPWDQILKLIDSFLIYKNDDIVGRVVLMNIESFGPKTVNVLGFTLCENKEEILIPIILKRILESCTEYEEVIFHTGPWGIQLPKELFEKYGMEFDMKLAYYEKTL